MCDQAHDWPLGIVFTGASQIVYCNLGKKSISFYISCCKAYKPLSTVSFILSLIYPADAGVWGKCWHLWIRTITKAFLQEKPPWVSSASNLGSLPSTLQKHCRLTHVGCCGTEPSCSDSFTCVCDSNLHKQTIIWIVSTYKQFIMSHIVTY